MNLGPGRDDREIVAVAKPDRATERESARHLGVDVRVAAAAEPDVDRVRMLERGPEHGAQVIGIRGADHGQVRDRAHHAEVLGRVMARAVEAHRDARVGADDPDRQVGIGAVGPDLLGGEDARERGEGRGVR